MHCSNYFDKYGRCSILNDQDPVDEGVFILVVNLEIAEGCTSWQGLHGKTDQKSRKKERFFPLLIDVFHKV